MIAFAETSVPYAPTLAPIVRDWALSWEPKPRISTEQWAEENVHLPEQITPMPGPFLIKRSPYVRGPFRAFDDPVTKQMTLVWGTQLAKTLVLQILLAKVAATIPAPCLLATPDLSSNRKLRDKFKLICQESPNIWDIAGVNEWNDKVLAFARNLIFLGYAGSTQTLSGEACKFVFVTEADRWRDHFKQGSSFDKARQRIKAFFSSLVFAESSPTDETSLILALFEDSDQRRYNLPCQRCGHHQELRCFPHKEGPFAGRGGIQGLQHANGNWLTPSEARLAAWYECEADGCRIEDRHKHDMNTRGVWCPRGQTVDRRGDLVGTPERSPRHAGFHLSSLYSEMLTFGDVAAEYLATRDDPATKKVFINDWLALRSYASKRPPKWKTIGQRLAAGHPRGKVPDWAIFLTCGADVQDDCVYFVVRAWGEGCRSALVVRGRCNQKFNADGEAIRSSDLDEFGSMVLNVRFPLLTANPVGHQSLPVFRAGIDCQGHRQAEVAEWVRNFNAASTERVYTFAGDNRIAQAGELYKFSLVDKNTKTGKPYPGGLRLWRIAVDVFKEDIRSRWEIPLDGPGVWLLYDGILTDGEDYLRQICNEVKRVDRSSSGQKKMIWRPADNRIGNHYWDCEVYSRAMAEICVSGNWKDLAFRAAPPVDRVPQPSRPEVTTPDGRAFCVSDR